MIFFLLVLLLATAPFVSAKYDPLSVPNNKYGIHIVDPSDVADAAKLVNSTGGDWGYVTLVIQDDDRDKGKWQRVFDEMRALHLIPIMRIATHIDRDAWAKPYEDSARDWAKFLNDLNWPVENRYVVVFNEPNHTNEWGRDINPEEYAETYVRHAKALHEASEDFFVLPAGLDVSAASDGRSLDAAVYLRRMRAREPNLFDHVDGWTSHSYPNPGFSGSPYATGRGTVRTFQWEASQLPRKLPVFITETGWIRGPQSSELIGQYLRSAAATAWTDPEIVAITPFLLNYQAAPFEQFSWRMRNSIEFYPHFYSYQNIAKVKGQPKQRERYTLEHKLIPNSLVAGSTYELSTLIRNEGQGIFSKQHGYTIELITEPKFTTVIDPLPVMEPNQYGTLTMHVETPNLPGSYPYRVEVRHDGSSTVVEAGTLTLVPPPSIDISIQMGWRTDNDVSNATVLIYDHVTPIHKVPGVSIANGKATVGELRNVVPGNTYRVVVLIPYYLPRQQIVSLKRNTTPIRIPRFYPLDFNKDGALTTLDLFALVKLPPNFIASLFIGP